MILPLESALSVYVCAPYVCIMHMHTEPQEKKSMLLLYKKGSQFVFFDFDR